jgi:lipopolysaccharide transport system permease protein
MCAQGNAESGRTSDGGGAHREREPELTQTAEIRYSAGSSLREPSALVRSMWRDTLAGRELAWRLFVRDVSAQHRQSLLGYLWLLVPPLITMSVWVLLRSQGIIGIGETEVPYPVFVLSGLVVWEAFKGALNSPRTMIDQSSSLLGRVNFPREALLLAGLGHVCLGLAVRLFLLALVFLWFRMPLPGTVFLAPLGLAAVIGLGYGIGLLLAPAGMLFRDVGRALTAIVGLWFFLTPVVYPPPSGRTALFINRLNPVSPLLISTREMLTTGNVTRPGDFLIAAALTVVLFILGWTLFRVATPHLVARLGA